MSIPVLVLCDDQWHPGTDVQHGLHSLADTRFDFDFITHGSKWSSSLMSRFPVVIVAKMNHLSAENNSPWLTNETQRAFPDFVQSGGGLFLIHGGTGYGHLREMSRVTGGAFVRHPDQCAVTIEPQPQHPLASGVAAFTEQDEHYFVTLDAADVQVFLRSRSQHGAQPAGWTRSEGKGRVCAVTPGHRLAVWLNPEFQKVLRIGLTWLAKLD